MKISSLPGGLKRVALEGIVFAMVVIGAVAFRGGA